ncbi:DSBA-like thioredoxin domain protein [Ceratobasidium sp. AG-Ba]|nr:DSBA-like thioredoxin domain protein [Ceratobasidium sp. AG-Ba]QRW01486.1 DSBA-like thioredoxin domain protein [Ceratobasidium sp. AG-Ba]
MAPPRISIKLCYDVVSPFSYLAFEILVRYRDIWNIDLELCPFYLGGVMSASGNRPPMSVKRKGDFLVTDVGRLAGESGLTIKINWGGFPPNTIQCARFLRAYKDEASPEELEKVTRHLFVEMFDRETNPASPAFLRSLVPALVPEDKFSAIIARSQSQEIKDCLKTESAALVNEYGAFGFPWIIVRGADGATASFFGSDRFANMAWWLGDEYKWTGPHPNLHKSKL